MPDTIEPCALTAEEQTALTTFVAEEAEVNDFEVPGLRPWVEPLPPQVYPLPLPGEDTPLNNDNPWDWLRLQDLYAYPPKIVKRVQRRAPDALPDDPDVLVEHVEITCFPKREARPPMIACRCGTAPADPDEPQSPDAVRNGSRIMRVRHRRMFDKPTWLVIERRRFRCKRCGDTFYEEVDDVLTDVRATDQLYWDVVYTAIKRPFSDAAVLNCVDPAYVKRLFKDHAQAKLKDYRFKIPEVMGVDEVFLFDNKKANFICTDLDSKRILDIGKGKTDEEITELFTRERPDDFNDLRFFVQDMEKNFRKFARKNFKNAKVVVDKFHLLMAVNECMERARKDYGNASPNGLRKSLSSQRFLFLLNQDRLTDEERALRDDLLKAYPAISLAFETKRRFYAIYRAKTRASAEETYKNWAERVQADGAKAFWPLLDTMENWHNEIFNYYDAKGRYSNGYVEAMNGRLRRMHDLCVNLDFETLRAKAVLRYGEFHDAGNFRFRRVVGPRNGWRHQLHDRDWVSSGFEAEALFRDLEAGQF